MENDLLKIGAAYVRVSDERQDEYSPDSQLKKIREYAKKEGYLIPDEYVFYDDGISGKSASKRNNFNLMIATVKEKDSPIDAIFVWKFSRFARNQQEAIVYKSLLRKMGISVISVSEPLPDGPFGSLIERIIEWMDEFYLINLSVEVTRGMEEKISRGEPVVPPPFGYIMKDKKYYPDEESGKADIVREVFQRYADGEKQRAIAMSLGERGVRTKFGNPPENRWIDYMLHNPCYIGKIRWSQNGSKAVHNRDYHNENVSVADGNHEPLISMELWDKVQKMLDDQSKRYPKYARRAQPIEYMLKGLIRCDCCNGTLAMSNVTSGKSGTRTLQCHNYNKGSCTTSHSVTVPKIESALISGLEKAVAENTFNIVPTLPKKTEKAVVDYDKLIAVEERRLERLREAYLAEIDTLEQYAKNKKEVTARIDDLKARRDKVVDEAKVDPTAFAKKVLGVVEFIKRDDVTPKAKNEALRTIIEKAIYEKAQGNLAIYFHDF